MKRFVQELLIDDRKLIGTSKSKIEILLGEPHLKNSDEWVYIIEKYCFGILKRKLYLFFFEEKVMDYYIGIL